MTSELVVHALDRVTAERRVDDIVALESDLTWQRWTAEAVLAERPQKWGLSVFVESGGSLVGVGITSRSTERTAHLHRLVVARDARGHGVGETIVRAVAQAAGRTGLDTVAVKVEPGNTGALRFYDRLGFVDVSPPQKALRHLECAVSLARSNEGRA